MTYQGKFINNKNVRKVSDYLEQWLGGDEEIIALFRATQTKPQTDGLVFTNHRILMIRGMHFGEFCIVMEIAADDIEDFIVEKGVFKSKKLSIKKEDGDTIPVGFLNKDDTLLIHEFLPKISGRPSTIVDKFNTERERIKTQSLQNKIADSERLKKERLDKIANKKKIDAEKKAMKNAKIEARGANLGSVFVKYIGGYSPGIKKTYFEGFLNCYENEVEYTDRGINIPANQIISLEITGKEQTSSRLSVTRMVTLGVFSLAAPKRSTKKEASIYIGLKDGRQIMFHTDSLTESDVHRKLANAISHYASAQASQINMQESLEKEKLDVAGEIERFADLRNRGILTDEEFEAKKKQLLNL